MEPLLPDCIFHYRKFVSKSAKRCKGLQKRFKRLECVNCQGFLGVLAVPKVKLITSRSQVQILSPQLCSKSRCNQGLGYLSTVGSAAFFRRTKTVHTVFSPRELHKMPRLGTSYPKYRKHKASGQAVVTLSGQDFYLGPHGTAVSRQEYDRVVCEWLARSRRPKNADQEVHVETTVVELAADYKRFAEGYYRKNGQMTNEVNA